MAAPNEGTTSLPSDANGEIYWGLWDGAAYRSWRGDTNGNAKVLLYGADNTPLLTTSKPGYIAATDGAIVALGTTTDGEASTGDGNVIQILKNLRTRLAGTLGVTIAGGSSPIGSVGDAEVAVYPADASVIAILKRIRTILGGTLNVAISALSLDGTGVMKAALTNYVAAGTASGMITGLGATPGLRLMGYAANETAGSSTPASFRIRQANVTGAPLAVCKMVANQGREEWYGPNGKDAATGMYLQNIAGTFELSVFYMVEA